MFNTPWSQILLFVAVCLLIWIVSWYGGFYNYPKCRNPYLPPGFIIGLVWPVLFGFMGYAHYLTYEANKSEDHPGGDHSVASVAIIVFAAWCLLYPFLMNRSEQYARILNYISLIVVFVLALLVIKKSQTAFYYLIPVIAWIAYVNLADFIHINQICKC